MTFLDNFRPYWTRARLLAIVDRVTARCQDPVWSRVSERIPTMGIHEARGYIRARAAAVIVAEVDRMSESEPQLGPAEREKIVRTVRHRLVRRLLFDSVRRRQTRVPAVRRIAA